ncbi:MAG: ATP synthase subunit b [Dehalococcoidia bacterium]|nr:ATP synthase subunit b [Bacillota bacterium]
MIINWYTVFFQIINFIALVFLLRRYLYGPIIESMAARESKIIEREEAAAKIASEAVAQGLDYKQKVTTLQDRDAEVLAKVKENAEIESRQLLAKAREQVDETHKRWHEAVAREQESFIHNLRSQVGRQACQIAKQCLKELADEKLETMIWAIFPRKLQQLSPEEKNKLQKAFDGAQKVLLKSTFKPTEEKLQELTVNLSEIFGKKVQLTQQTSTDLICGVELEVGGYRIAWSVIEYLSEMEKEILEHLHKSGNKKGTADA